MKNNKVNKVQEADDEIDDLFDQIESEEKKKESKALATGKNPAFLTFTKNQTVRGVILPYRPSPTDTFVTYEKVGFFLKAENLYVDLGLSPKSKGVRNDPVAKAQWDMFDAARKVGDETKKKKSYDLLPKREELVNFLVLEDTATPANVGTVMVLKYGAAINKDGEPVSVIYSKIREAIFGDKKEKIGQKAYLTKKFPVIRPLVIKVKEKGGFNDYTDTSFDDAEEHNFTNEEINEFYDQCYDLRTFVPELKPNSELTELLNQYWYQTDIGSQDDVPDDDDIDISEPEETPVAKTAPKSAKDKLREKAQAKEKEAAKSAPKVDEVDDMIGDFDDDFDIDE